MPVDLCVDRMPDFLREQVETLIAGNCIGVRVKNGRRYVSLQELTPYTAPGSDEPKERRGSQPYWELSI